MKSIAEILSELNSLPEEFQKDCEAGKWCKAALQYEKAVVVSSFIEMEEEKRDRLLSRFEQGLVIKAFRAAGWYKEKKDVKRA